MAQQLYLSNWIHLNQNAAAAVVVVQIIIFVIKSCLRFIIILIECLLNLSLVLVIQWEDIENWFNRCTEHTWKNERLLKLDVEYQQLVAGGWKYYLFGSDSCTGVHWWPEIGADQHAANIWTVNTGLREEKWFLCLNWPTVDADARLFISRTTSINNNNNNNIGQQKTGTAVIRH